MASLLSFSDLFKYEIAQGEVEVHVDLSAFSRLTRADNCLTVPTFLHLDPSERVAFMQGNGDGAGASRIGVGGAEGPKAQTVSLHECNPIPSQRTQKEGRALLQQHAECRVGWTGTNRRLLVRLDMKQRVLFAWE